MLPYVLVTRTVPKSAAMSLERLIVAKLEIVTFVPTWRTGGLRIAPFILVSVTLPNSQPINAAAGVKSRLRLTVVIVTSPPVELMLLRASKPCCTAILMSSKAEMCCSFAEPRLEVRLILPSSALTNSVGSLNSRFPSVVVTVMSPASERTVLSSVTFVPALIVISVPAIIFCSTLPRPRQDTTAPLPVVASRAGGTNAFGTAVIVTIGCSPTA